MTSPRHSPPPSAAAPRPRGILKNASDGVSVPQVKDTVRAGPQEVDENGNRLAWDESNLTLHEIEREAQAARMKIDEPKTPFVRSASLGPMDDDSNFDLDLQGGASYFPGGSSSGSGDTAVEDGSSSGSTGGAPPTASAASTTTSAGERRSSAAEQLAANTIANAGRRPSNAGSATSSGGGAGPAIGLDSVDLAASGSNLSGSGANSRRSDSRSPSFTLPNSRRSSAAGDRSREGVRQEMRSRDDAMEGVEQSEDAFGDDDEASLDPEAKAKQAAFAQKRNAHYGNEAEAMRVAAALAAQEEDEEEEDEEEEDEEEGDKGGAQATRSIPPVPQLPNGKTTM